MTFRVFNHAVCFTIMCEKVIYFLVKKRVKWCVCEIFYSFFLKTDFFSEYERSNPEITIKPAENTPEQMVQQIIAFLKSNGILK